MAEPLPSARTPSGPTALACDLFCRVIDNYGDAGVTWRLARLLQRRLGAQVRIFIDDDTPLRFIAPAPGEIAILPWGDASTATPAADLVVELFACELPASYIDRMAARARPPLWINLEYLSAEAWVDDCHARPSTHARTGLSKYFYFPGFTAASGGLLIDDTPTPPPDARVYFVYCYDTPTIAQWMQHLVTSGAALRLLLAPGAAQAMWTQTVQQFGAGRITAVPLPYLSQEAFDATIRSAHMAVVRGEDSFVQAQLAAVPMVWDIYAQDDGAHHPKREAWMQRYISAMPAGLAQPWRAFQHAIGGEGAVGPAWEALQAQFPLWRQHARTWAEHLRQHDFAARLAQFVAEKLK